MPQFRFVIKLNAINKKNGGLQVLLTFPRILSILDNRKMSDVNFISGISCNNSSTVFRISFVCNTHTLWIIYNFLLISLGFFYWIRPHLYSWYNVTLKLRLYGNDTWNHNQSYYVLLYPVIINRTLLFQCLSVKWLQLRAQEARLPRVWGPLQRACAEPSLGTRELISSQVHLSFPGRHLTGKQLLSMDLSPCMKAIWKPPFFIDDVDMTWKQD